MLVLIWVLLPARQQVDWSTVTELNNRGVGSMEQFEYATAADAFKQIVEIAPEWAPGRINWAIALYNTAKEPGDPVLAQAAALFNEVLRIDPDNRHAHFNLGMIALYEGRGEEAYPHFLKVSELDPTDAHSWYQMAKTCPEGDSSATAKSYLDKALKLDPYLNAARYALAQHPHERDDAISQQLLDDHKALINANWENEYRIRYSEMGRYAEVIGRTPAKATTTTGPIPMFQAMPVENIALADGTRWVAENDLTKQGPIDGLRSRLRARFGGTMILLDANRDGKPDILMLSAVVENGAIRNVLLVNQGQGRFRDETARAGLVSTAIDFGCSAADFDSDGFTDLMMSGTKPRLYRNRGDGTFEDVTARLGIPPGETVTTSALPIDLDQDGDLDIVQIEYAATLREAVGMAGGTGKIAIWMNTSEAPPRQPGPMPPLKLQFKLLPEQGAFQFKERVNQIIATDIDQDRDVDLVILCENAAPRVVYNDRLMRFHLGEGPIEEVGQWSSGCVLDANSDGEMDLVLFAINQPPRLLIRKEMDRTEKLTDRFQLKNLDSGGILQAKAIDMDQDAHTDLIALGKDRRITWLHQQADGRFADVSSPVGVAPGDLWACQCADVDNDCNLDVIVWSETQGCLIYRNLGNGNRGLQLDITGRRDIGDNRRTNDDGIGVQLMIQTGPRITGIENTTLEAGLGVSRLPITSGVGTANQADVVRLRWPDQVPQAELAVPACQRVTITETNRKQTSCPVLFTWNGTRYEFVTDLLGGGALGEMGSDGSVRPPRPEESVKIEAGQLIAMNGKYRLKLAEPMNEVLYLDQVILEAIDLPPNEAVYPDERFTFGLTPPTQELMHIIKRIEPKQMFDHHQCEVTDLVRTRDGRFFTKFARRSWLGYAEEHWLEMRFDPVAFQWKPNTRYALQLAGGTDYPYPESIAAASQAGVELIGPILEAIDANGVVTPISEVGFPAGLTRTMMFELTPYIKSLTPRMRLRTNMQIYWDEIAIVELAKKAPESQACPLVQAALRVRGYAQEINMPGSPLVGYDDTRSDNVIVSKWQGRLTQLGDVTALAYNQDDRFVLCGPGEEIELEFDAKQLKPLKTGWSRSYVVRAKGYCKDMSPYTLTAGNVGPLPFREMKNYPYAETERPRTLAPDHMRGMNRIITGGKVVK